MERNGKRFSKELTSNIKPNTEGDKDIPTNMEAFNQEAKRPLGLIEAVAANTYITVNVKKKYQIILPIKYEE